MLALPLSFATNMVYGHISPEALGAYGAMQILVGTSFTFLVFGGANVFTRIVPALTEDDRFDFLRSYIAVVAVVFAGILAAGWIWPEHARTLLRTFGDPPRVLAVGLLAGSAASGLACWFLYAAAQPTWAVLSEKLVIAGFFVLALFALGPPRAALARGDVGFVWTGAVIVYVVASAVALWRVSLLRPATARRPRWLLPEGFWPLVAYTQLESVVSYVQVTLAPSLVLFWIDLGALGFLHAALRYVVLLTAIPASVMAVLSPELRGLAASGHREESLRQTGAAIRVCLLVLTPVVYGLVAFAEPAMALFGPRFGGQADLLRWTAPAALAAPVVLCGAGAALAVGAFRGYVFASIVYVAVATLLTAVLVPRWGATGAAAATMLGAFARQAAVLVLLRREGFVPPRRLAIAWVGAGVAIAVTLLRRPGLPASLGLWIALLAGFAYFGRVRLDELRRVVRLGLGAPTGSDR